MSKRNIKKIKCEICNQEYSIVGISNHFRDAHGLTTEEYVHQYNEFRPKYIDYERRAKLNKIRCLICNSEFGSERLLTYHIRMVHGMHKKDYVKKIIFNNDIQYCRCGCKQEVKLLNQLPYKREYITGHNSNGETNIMWGKTHSVESKEQMSKSAISRMHMNTDKMDTEPEKQFRLFLINNNIDYIQQYPTDQGSVDFYLLDDDMLVEIDGDYWHPLKKENLNFQLISGAISEYKKSNLDNLYRLRVTDITQVNSLLDIKHYNSPIDLSITYKQHIIEKSYFENFLVKKGKQKLERYIPLLLKFVRTFQPQFPYPDLEENIDDIINKIHNYNLTKLKIDSGFNNNSSHIGSNYLKHYFKSYWNSAFKKQLTPVEVWQNDELMKKIIAYRIGVNNSGEVFDFSWHQLVRGISARRFTISWFKPILAAAIYKQIVEELKLDDSLVTFDPCCGFGARLLAFKSLYPDGTYIGCEPNIDTYNELSQLINNAKFNNVQIYNCKFEDLIIDFKYDFVFTSIPYYDKEVYSNDINYESIDDWEAQFFNPLMRLQNKYINLPVELYDVLQLDNTIWNKIQSNTSHYNQNASSKQELIIK